MKKVLALLLVVIMMMGLCACGGDKKEDTAKKTEKAEDVKEDVKEDAKEDAKDDAKDDAEEPAAADDSDTIKIGCYQPLTEANAIQGEGAQNSVMLYIKELNERGGLLGKKVEAVYYDDASNPEEAVKIVSKLLEVDHIDICIGSIISSCLLASGEALNNAKIPTFGIGLSPTWMDQGWEYFFRPTINTSKSIPSLIGLMDKFGFESVAIFEGQDDYGASAGQTMRDACEAAGKTVTTTENYVSGDTDFSGQVAKILDSDPDCVFLGVLGGEVGNIIKQVRQFGYEGILFYSETPMQDAYDIAGDAINYVVYSYPYITYQSLDQITDPYMLEFCEKYEAEYGYLPLGDSTYRGWDAMLTLERAVTDANSLDGEAIKNAVLEISDLKGLAGTFDYTQEKNGEGLNEFASWVVVDGENVNLDDWLESEDYQEYSEQMGW